MTDHTLADSIAVWKRDRMAQRAGACAIVAALAALVAWLTLLVAPGGDICGKPLFWLLAVPPSIWMGALQEPKPRALRLLRPVLVAAPCLVLIAQLDPCKPFGTATNATRPWMIGLLAVSSLCAGLGAMALVRSTLPGGRARPQDLPPAPQSQPPLVRATLGLASVSLSGTLVNGLLFAMAAISAGNSTDLGLSQLWPLLIPGVTIAGTTALMFRGAF